ncbi:MAG: hypothetical protein FWF44_09025 [Defluviitaleaceae bacterium]|nr:hypothetical protein [Defluviitaleaceae bacterium]
MPGFGQNLVYGNSGNTVNYGNNGYGGFGRAGNGLFGGRQGAGQAQAQGRGNVGQRPGQPQSGPDQAQNAQARQARYSQLMQPYLAQQQGFNQGQGQAQGPGPQQMPRQSAPAAADGAQNRQGPAAQPTGQGRQGASQTGGQGLADWMKGPLPDGVHFEPLDKSAKLFTQGAAGTPAEPSRPAETGQAGVSAPEAQPQAQEAGAPDEFERRLSLMIQNERNAAVFYVQLARRAGRDDFRSFLEKTSAESLRRQELFQSVFRSRKGADYAVAESDIRPADFPDGLELALDEECNFLEDLAWLYENAADDKVRWAVQGQVNKKVSQINMMNSMARKRD